MPGAVECPTCKGRQDREYADQREAAHQRQLLTEDELLQNEQELVTLARELARTRPQAFVERHHIWRRQRLFRGEEAVRCPMPAAVPVGKCFWMRHGPADLRGRVERFQTGVTASGAIVRMTNDDPVDRKVKKCGDVHSAETSATLGDGKESPVRGGLFLQSTVRQTRAEEIARIVAQLRGLSTR